MKHTARLPAPAATYTNPRSPYGGTRHRLASPRTRRFDFADAGRHLTVETDDVWTARILHRAFAPMRCAPARSDCFARIERNVSNPSGTFGGAHMAVRETFARFAAGYDNAVALYAACATLEDAGVAIFGESGIGKTILLLHLVQRGMRFLGDETAIAALTTGAIWAQPRLPALREAGLALVPSQPMQRAILASRNVAHLRSGRFWYALSPEEVDGISPNAAPHPLRAIVALKGRADNPSIAELSREDVLRLAAGRSYFKPQSLSEVARIRRFFRGIRAFSLVAGDPANTADMLMETLQCA